MARIQLVILDFDGTLVDTAPDLIRSTNFFLDSEGLDTLPPETIRLEIGMGLRKLIVSLYPGDNKTDEDSRRIEGDFLKIYERELLHSPRLYEGALEFLSEWEGQIAIVSNKRRRFILPILEHLGIAGLPWVSIIGGDTYPNMKPHPEPFLAAMLAAGCTPEETLVVGDGAPDILGALAVGAKSVAVEFGYSPVDELMALGAWGRIESFSDLLPLLKSLNSATSSI